MAKKKPQQKQPEPQEPSLRLEWRSPVELAENPQNWRFHPAEQIAALTGAISEVGWAGACLFNERTGRLIDGHARRKVALEQGTEKVPVLVGSWSEEQEAKILATLDPLSAMAVTDKTKLDALLRDVQTGNESLGKMLTELAEKAAIIPVRMPTEPANDPAEEWQGMPEFEQEDQRPIHEVKILFGSEEAIQDFNRRIEQDVKERTWTWHPKKEINKPGEFVAEDESDES